MILNSNWLKDDNLVLKTEHIDNNSDLLTSFLYCCYPKFRESDEHTRSNIEEEFRLIFPKNINIENISKEFEMNIYVLEGEASEVSYKSEMTSNNVSMLIKKEKGKFYPVLINKNDTRRTMIFMDYDYDEFKILRNIGVESRNDLNNIITFINWYSYFP